MAPSYNTQRVFLPFIWIRSIKQFARRYIKSGVRFKTSVACEKCWKCSCNLQNVRNRYLCFLMLPAVVIPEHINFTSIRPIAPNKCWKINTPREKKIASIFFPFGTDDAKFRDVVNARSVYGLPNDIVHWTRDFQNSSTTRNHRLCNFARYANQLVFFFLTCSSNRAFYDAYCTRLTLGHGDETKGKGLSNW